MVGEFVDLAAIVNQGQEEADEDNYRISWLDLFRSLISFQVMVAKHEAAAYNKRSRQRRRVCRVCRKGSGSEKLLSACNCTGSKSLIHHTCLRNWKKINKTDRCEKCLQRFIIPTSISIWQFFRRPMSPLDAWRLSLDIEVFILLPPVCAVVTWLTLFRVTEYSNTNLWETIGLATLATFLIVLYLIWFICAIRYYKRRYAEWKTYHCTQLMQQVDNGKPKPAITCAKKPARNYKNYIYHFPRQLVKNVLFRKPSQVKRDESQTSVTMEQPTNEIETSNVEDDDPKPTPDETYV